MLRIGNSYDPLLRRPFAAFKLRNSKGIFLEIFYKVVGHGTRIMSCLGPDKKLELLGPLGNGFKLPEKRNTTFIVAGGMGIVPLRGLIYHLVDSEIGRVHVFVGTKSTSRLLFQDEFQKMGVPLHVSTEDGSAGHHGLVTELFEQYLEDFYPMDKHDKICFGCGPSPMLEVVAQITSQYCLPCQVSLEARMACGIGACLGCVVRLRNQIFNNPEGEKKYGRVCLEGPVFDVREIEW